MKKAIREVIMLFFILIPQFYLFLIWDQLPEIVPTHFNLKGEADDWHHKSFLIWMPSILHLGIYLLTLLMPKMDPKNSLWADGNKFQNFRLLLMLLLAGLYCYILYKTQDGELTHPNILIAFIGGIFLLVGNYMQTLRPNYFIGIRTPWTLKSEMVWRKTHRLGGRLWIVAGVGIILTSLLVYNNLALAIITGSLLLGAILSVLAYSYKLHKLERNIDKELSS